MQVVMGIAAMAPVGQFRFSDMKRRARAKIKRLFDVTCFLKRGLDFCVAAI